MQVAFYFAGEITQVLDAIPWVRCASGNVCIEWPTPAVFKFFPLSGMVLHHKEFCRFPVSTHFPYSKETGETTKSLEKVIISRNFVFSCFWSLISSRLRKCLLFKNKSHMMGLFSTVPSCTWLCPTVPGCTLAYHDLPFQRMSHSATDWPEFFSGLNDQKI